MQKRPFNAHVYYRHHHHHHLISPANPSFNPSDQKRTTNRDKTLLWTENIYICIFFHPCLCCFYLLESYRMQMLPGRVDIERLTPLAVEVLKARGRPRRSTASIAALLGTGTGANSGGGGGENGAGGEVNYPTTVMNTVASLTPQVRVFGLIIICCVHQMGRIWNHTICGRSRKPRLDPIVPRQREGEGALRSWGRGRGGGGITTIPYQHF